MRVFLAAAVIVAMPLSLWGQEVSPWGSRDFSARRVGVPAAGAKPRIVQIDPTEEPYHLTPARKPGEEATPRPRRAAFVPGDSSAWFWSGVSSELAASSPGRLDAAIARLSLADRKLAPDWDDMAGLVESWGGSLTEKSRGTRVSPALALAVLATESAGRKNATSSAGAQGLMQLMPATAERFNVSDPMVPEDNIAGGVAYLDFLLRAFGEDPILTLAAYNAGEGAVAGNGGVPPFAETRDYVPKVLGAWSVARLFCEVPPKAVTDPCIFVSDERKS